MTDHLDVRWTPLDLGGGRTVGPDGQIINKEDSRPQEAEDTVRPLNVNWKPLNEIPTVNAARSNNDLPPSEQIKFPPLSPAFPQETEAASQRSARNHVLGTDIDKFLTNPLSNLIGGPGLNVSIQTLQPENTAEITPEGAFTFEENNNHISVRASGESSLSEAQDSIAINISGPSINFAIGDGVGQSGPYAALASLAAVHLAIQQLDPATPLEEVLRNFPTHLRAEVVHQMTGGSDIAEFFRSNLKKHSSIPPLLAQALEKQLNLGNIGATTLVCGSLTRISPPYPNRRVLHSLKLGVVGDSPAFLVSGDGTKGEAFVDTSSQSAPQQISLSPQKTSILNPLLVERTVDTGDLVIVMSDGIKARFGRISESELLRMIQNFLRTYNGSINGKRVALSNYLFGESGAKGIDDASLIVIEAI